MKRAIALNLDEPISFFLCASTAITQLNKQLESKNIIFGGTVEVAWGS